MRINMKAHHTPGLLITFCGLDGSGKTTIIHFLHEYFTAKGLPVKLTKQPTDAVRNSEIFRNYMDCPDHDAFDYRSLSLLAASDRVQHANRTILPLLEQGNIVVSDRYFYSCLANLRARGYTQDKWIYEVASFVPKPDIAFFIDVDVETAIQRVRCRVDEKDRYIDIPLQYRLRDEYRLICKNAGGIQIDSGCEMDRTFQSVLDKLKFCA